MTGRALLSVVVSVALADRCTKHLDGLFNLGSALSFAQVLPPGVYVLTNGRAFAWDRVQKNLKTGVFATS